MSKSQCLTGRLAALSSAAILAVYAVGYTATEHAAQGAGAAQTVAVHGVSPTGGVSNATPASPTVTIKRPSASATGTPIASSAYRDGTYVGTGTSRHGSIEAMVTISGGKITAVEISQCLTRYPCSRIATLPGQVVSRQSAQVRHVSGATDSSNAFVQAVNHALTSAA